MRTLKYEDAVYGRNYPQTPCKIKIGIWAGGDPDNSEGTIEWAGGETDYDDGPFNMYVESVKIINYNPASTYKYTDKTGAYSSIKMTNGTSSATLSNSTTKTSSSSGSSKLSSSSSSSASASASANTTSAASITVYSSMFVASMVAFAVGLLQL